MNSAACPRCGGTLVNGRCAKCNPLSKSSEVSRSFVKPISYVAPAATQTPVADRQRTWQTPTVQDTMAIRKMHQRSKQRSRLMTALVLLILAFAGYKVYEFFVREALSYSGYYWNEKLLFALTIPASGWAHYPDSQLQSLPIVGVQDAFYKGKDPDRPDLLMAIWTSYDRGGYNDVRAALSEEDMRQHAQDDLNTQMGKSGFSFDIQDTSKIILGLNPGFKIHGSAQRGPQSFHTLSYCAFKGHFSYTIVFLGSATEIQQDEKELNEMMKSFEFRSSLI
jgi:hypothetical protein